MNGSVIETWLMVLAGIIGFFMKRFGFSPAAVVVALVLGPIAEETLRQSLIISGGSPVIFYERPISLILLILVAIFSLGPMVWWLVRGKRVHGMPTDPADVSTTRD